MGSCGLQKGLAFGRDWSGTVSDLDTMGAPRSRPAGLIADAGLRWCDGDAVTNRMEDLKKGEVLKGEQPAILDEALFEAVQAKLNEQVNNHRSKWTKSEGLLIGRLFDDRGDRMSPTHARKGNVQYRYYLSSALLQGTAAHAGSVRRVPATAIETLVIQSVRDHLKPSQPIDDRSLINTHVARIKVQPNRLVIHLAEEASTLEIPWQKTPAERRREILLPEGIRPEHARPIRSETRIRLVAAIARGRRWLDELIADPRASAASIAKRENCSA